MIMGPLPMIRTDFIEVSLGISDRIGSKYRDLPLRNICKKNDIFSKINLFFAKEKGRWFYDMIKRRENI